MKSFKQMRKDGELVRADAEKIDYRSIHVEPGFNPPGRTEEEEADDEELYRYIVKHGVMALSQWEVRPRPDGGVFIVDGHRRHAQTGRAIKDGHFKPDAEGRYLIPIKQFVGSDLDRLYRIGTSNKHKKIPTCDRPSASEVAAFILAAFPGACLLALTFFPESTIPWLAKLLEVLK